MLIKRAYVVYNLLLLFYFVHSTSCGKLLINNEEKTRQKLAFNEEIPITCLPGAQILYSE